MQDDQQIVGDGELQTPPGKWIPCRDPFDKDAPPLQKDGCADNVRNFWTHNAEAGLYAHHTMGVLSDIMQMEIFTPERKSVTTLNFKWCEGDRTGAQGFKPVSHQMAAALMTKTQPDDWTPTREFPGKNPQEGPGSNEFWYSGPRGLFAVCTQIRALVVVRVLDVSTNVEVGYVNYRPDEYTSREVHDQIVYNRDWLYKKDELPTMQELKVEKPPFILPPPPLTALDPYGRELTLEGLLAMVTNSVTPEWRRLECSPFLLTTTPPGDPRRKSQVCFRRSGHRIFGICERTTDKVPSVQIRVVNGVGEEIHTQTYKLKETS